MSIACDSQDTRSRECPFLSNITASAPFLSSSLLSCSEGITCSARRQRERERDNEIIRGDLCGVLVAGGMYKKLQGADYITGCSGISMAPSVFPLRALEVFSLANDAGPLFCWTVY